MKIALDVAQTCVERAGCGWYADCFARAFARLPGIEIELLHHFGGWCNHNTTRGTRIAGVRNSIDLLDEVAARDYWQTVASAGLPGSPAIVHSHCFEVPLIPGTRLVYTIYDVSFWLHHAFATETTRQICQRGVLDALERAAGLAFISEASRHDFESVLPGWLEESRRPTAILPCASRFVPKTSTRAPVAIDAPWLCVGSVEPRKNHSTLLDAFEIYRAKRGTGARSLVVAGGRGWNSEREHARMRALQETGAVRYVGYVSDSDLIGLYQSAFALVQPSWHEGFGLPVVEAMSLGLPAICSDIASLREVGGDAPLYAPADDAVAIAEAMLSMESDNVARSAADRGLKRSTLFSWHKTAECALRFYQEVLRSPLP